MRRDGPGAAARLRAAAVARGPLHADEHRAGVRAVLAETGFPKHRLELEITESVLLHNNEAFAMLETLRADILSAGFSSIDYADLADATSLQPIAQKGHEPARLLVAARIGSTRLIDNMPLV